MGGGMVRAGEICARITDRGDRDKNRADATDQWRGDEMVTLPDVLIPIAVLVAVIAVLVYWVWCVDQPHDGGDDEL
jgi:hypothetical protein